MADLVSMEMTGDWAEALDRLGEAAHSVQRSGGNAMAGVFRDEAIARAPVYSGKIHTYKTGKKAGRDNAKPGQLREAIYRAFAASLSGETQVIYEISWNHTKAPHGHWMENGSSRHAAHPFLRPAYEAMKLAALKAGQNRMAVRFSEELTKLAK